LIGRQRGGKLQLLFYSASASPVKQYCAQGGSTVDQHQIRICELAWDGVCLRTIPERGVNAVSDQFALLRAIADAYDDDTPRLVYADWLQEQGGKTNIARAEFIRMQIEWNRSPYNAPNQDELLKKAEALAKRHKAAWLAPFGKDVIDDADFRRGFVEVVNMDADSLDPEHPLPWHLEPTATVWMFGMEGDIIRALPALAGTYGLAFEPGSEEAPDTPGAPPKHPGDRLAAAVAAVPGLASLRELSLSGARMTDEGARALAASPLRKLRNLDLWWNWMTAEGWKTLVNSPIADTLEELRLSSEYSEEREGAGHAYPGNKGAAALAASSRLARVRVLALENCRLGKVGLTALATSPHLTALEELAFSNNDWTDQTLQALVGVNPFPKLRQLHLGINQLGEGAMRLLAQSPVCAHLTGLRLGANRIDDAALAAFLAAPDLSRLEYLDLMSNPLGDDGIKLLARCKKFTGLRMLCLAYIQLTDAAVDALLDASWLDQLDELNLGQTELNKPTQRRLKKRLGKVVSFG
jgi:uncharacterized protein (TIGR02996 family)